MLMKLMLFLCPGAFCRYRGAKMTRNYFSVVLKITVYCVGIQAQVRYFPAFQFTVPCSSLQMCLYLKNTIRSQYAILVVLKTCVYVFTYFHFKFQVVYELPVKNQWCFDVEWCPRNPSVFSAASFDGWISVYSVMGGSLEAQHKSQADRVCLVINNKTVIDVFF